jgi:hypothetical protein
VPRGAPFSINDTPVVRGLLQFHCPCALIAFCSAELQWFMKWQRMQEGELAAIDQFVSQKCLIPPVINAQNLCSIYQCPD